jgi:hypothetical protein
MTTEARTSVTGPRPPSAPAPAVRRQPLTATQLWVSLASLFAGGIHLAVTPEHLEHWWVFGTFFIVTGVFQLAFAGVVLRRTSWPVALTGIAVNLGIVLIWVVSRTRGLPISPPEDITAHEGTHLIEGVGPADLAATGAELVVVCLLVTFLPARMRRVTVDVLLATGVGLWALRLSGVLG